MPTKNPFLAVAHGYAEKHAWAIIPVHGKAAACNWSRYQLTKPSRRQLGGLFSIPGVTGLAVVLGAVSAALRVRDFDLADAYLIWAAAHPDLAATLPTAKTARGYHVFFRADIPEGITTFSDGELRAGKAYVVLPPSVHPDGGIYEWLLPPGDTIPLLPNLDAAGLSGSLLSTQGPNAPVPPAVDEVITRTLPTGYGQRTRKLWEFARRLKGLSGLVATPDALGSYIREWHQRAVPFIKTKAFETTELAFYDAWTNAETPLNDDQFLTWIKPALEGPDSDWLKAVFFPQPGKRLLRVCAALQERAGTGPFFLAARAGASAVGIDPTYASQLLKRLETAGFLVVVDNGAYNTGLATTWRYIGPECDDNALPSSRAA